MTSAALTTRRIITAHMQQRAARRIRRYMNGRWHLDEVGEVDGETVRSLINDGTLIAEAETNVYALAW